MNRITKLMRIALLAAVAFLLVLAPAASSAQTPAAKAEEAAKLAAVLKSDAGLYEKAKACQKLAVIGGKEAVAALAALLSDEKLAHYARFGLEPNPDPGAGEALREAMGKLQGKLLVGVINSIGVRRDAGALPDLKKLLESQDRDVAAAAAAAVGRIATPEAARALREALASAPEPLRVGLAEAMLACADGFLARKDWSEATASFDLLRQSKETPQHIQAAALGGAILARRDAGVALLAEKLASGDSYEFDVALGTARRVQGGPVTPALVEIQARLPAPRRALVIGALGDLGDASARPAVLDAARSGPPEVRVAAFRVLKSLGDASAVPVLLDAAAGGDAEAAAAALEALEALGGKDVDASIARMLDGSEGRLRLVLIDLAGRRRIASSRSALKKALDDGSEEVRAAALRSLGSTSEVEDLAGLLAHFIAPRSEREGAAAREALDAAVKRLPDKDGCAAKVLDATATAKPEAQARLIEVLRSIGGRKALAAVAARANSEDAAVRDAARKALGRWRSEDAAPEILALFKASPVEKDRLDLLGRFREVVSGLRFPKEERLALCGRALEASRNDEERVIVLKTYAAIPAPETLSLLEPHLKDPGLKEEAAAAMVTIVERILRYNPSAMRQPLEQVLAATTDRDRIAKAKELLRQAGGVK